MNVCAVAGGEAAAPEHRLEETMRKEFELNAKYEHDEQQAMGKG